MFVVSIGNPEDMNKIQANFRFSAQIYVHIIVVMVRKHTTIACIQRKYGQTVITTLSEVIVYCWTQSVIYAVLLLFAMYNKWILWNFLFADGAASTASCYLKTTSLHRGLHRMENYSICSNTIEIPHEFRSYANAFFANTTVFNWKLSIHFPHFNTKPQKFVTFYGCFHCCSSCDFEQKIFLSKHFFPQSHE